MCLPFVLSQGREVLVAVAVGVVPRFLIVPLVRVGIAYKCSTTCAQSATDKRSLAAAHQGAYARTTCAANESALAGADAAMTLVPLAMAVAVVVATVVLRVRIYGSTSNAQQHGCA